MMMTSSASSSSSSSPAGGSSFFTGFTQLCKGLAVILVGGYVLLQVFPSAVTYVALIPARWLMWAYMRRWFPKCTAQAICCVLIRWAA